MQIFAIELADRAVSFARAGQVLDSSPATVFDGSTGEAAGTSAWGALRSHPTATSSRHLESVLTQPDAPDRSLELLTADLARRLQAQRPAAGEPVWVIAPAVAGPRGLGAALGVLRQLALPVSGFVDFATASVAALGLDRSAIVIELGLHHIAATAVDVSAGTARRRRSISGAPIGLIELHQAFLELIAGSMVRRARFDPLHDAGMEQRLFDSIPKLTREVAAGTAKVMLTQGADTLEVELSLDQFALAAQFLTREVLRLIHELRPAGTPVTLVLPAAMLTLPGLRDALDQFVGCDVVSCADGFAAAAVSVGEHPEPLADDPPIRLLRRAPLQSTHRSLAGMITRARLGELKAAGPPPTHLLLGGRALTLGPEPFVVGRAQSMALVLPQGIAGVSRRHCTFVRDAEQLVLLDHSTFGTFVNGERVAERVRVYAGDRVRLGEPGVELALIAVGGTP
jgi:FHA domain